MKLYLVRHGETTNNALGLHQDETAQLSDVGLKQGEFLAHRFSKIKVDGIYASPAIRAYKTAEIIGQKINIEIRGSEFLKEKRNPSEIVGMPRESEEAKAIRKAIEAHSDDPSWHYSNEENFAEFKERVIKFFDVLKEAPEEHVLAVTHTGPIYLLVAAIIFGHDVLLEDYKKIKSGFKLDNTGITLCEFKEDKWAVRTLNDHSHLG